MEGAGDQPDPAALGSLGALPESSGEGGVYGPERG